MGWKDLEDPCTRFLQTPSNLDISRHAQPLWPPFIDISMEILLHAQPLQLSSGSCTIPPPAGGRMKFSTWMGEVEVPSDHPQIAWMQMDCLDVQGCNNG